MMNVNATKKVISAMLLGSLLVTGAAVYADTTAAADTAKAGANRPGLEQRQARGSELLSTLVTEGIITAEEKTILEKAMETQRDTLQANREAAKEALEKGEKPASHFARMAEEGLISDALADKIDAYMTQKREAAFAATVKPLVDAGTFKDTAAARTAMDAVREAMQAKMEALRPGTEREKVDFKSLTDAERTALKEKLEAQRTEMQKAHEAALEEVYDSLVDAGTLTQAQADALQTLMKDRPMGGRGHGMGPGGLNKAADTAQ